MLPFRNSKKSAIVVAIVILVALFHVMDLKRHLTLAALKANFELLELYHAAHPVASAAVFMALFILLSALALPGPLLMCLAAGALFGLIEGTVYVTVAATVGATLAFLAARYLFHDKIQEKFGRRLLRINTLLEKEGFIHLLLIRLIPVLPFTLINVGAALTKIPLRSFILATFLGIMPPGLILCNAGARLAEVDDIHEILTIKVLGSLLLLGIFPLMAILHRRIQREKGNHF